jgi:hypothetical protein
VNVREAARHHPHVRWLRKLWSSEAAPPAPVLLRVAEPGGAAPGTVTVEATWFPSGLTFERRHRTAEGLCVVPWVGEERRVELTVRTSAGRRDLSVHRDRADGGRVHDLRLDGPPGTRAVPRAG